MALIGGLFTCVYDENGKPDCAVDEEYWDEYHKSFLTNGVYPSPADSFMLKSNSGMTLTVRPGACFINGKYAYDKHEATVDITPAGAAARWDRIIVRMDIPTKQFSIISKSGTGVAPPELTRNSNTWELGLAVVFVPPGTTAIAQSAITDTRADSSVCGWVTAPLHEVSFAGLEAQCLESFQEFMQLIQGKLGNDPATSLQRQVNDLTSQLEEIELRVADQQPQIAALTPLNGFTLTNANTPAVAIRRGREVHVQIGVSQPYIANRTFTQLPAGMYDRGLHVLTATGGSNEMSYPVSVGADGRLSFNGAGQKDVYVNATFVLGE